MNIRIASVMIQLMVVAAPTFAAAHDGPHGAESDVVFQVGKNGEVKIGADLQVGGTLIKKGKYVFAHRIDGDVHIVVLTGVAGKDTPVAPVHEIRTKLVPSRDRVKGSALFTHEEHDLSYRITTIKVAGESGDHLPQN